MSTAFAGFQAVTYECSAEDAASIYKSMPDWTPEEGDAVLLSLKFGTIGPGILLDVSRLTEEELLAFQTHMQETFERALPIVQARDRIAREAEQNGDYSYERSNRGSPASVVKPRKEPEH